MGAIKNEYFDIEFIDRTINIMCSYRGKYNITLLLNCLLGLIILPSEFYNRKSGRFFAADISDIFEIQEMLNGIVFNPTKNTKNGWIPDKHNLRNLLKKIRNGVSHQQIECEEINGKWNKVVIRDFNMRNNNNLELEIHWTPKQLKKFAIFVANKYKSEIEKINEF